MTIDASIGGNPDRPDGRKQRGSRNRADIVEAMFSLIRLGAVAPSAAQVAAAANVSLRTVFRHFADMDGLYREMCDIVIAEIRPLLDAPLKTAHWREQVIELANQRAVIFERMLPLRVAVDARRHRSEFLMDIHRWFLAVERASFRLVLPPGKTLEDTLFAALGMALSFEAWRRLRRDQDLSVEQAGAAMLLTVTKLAS